MTSAQDPDAATVGADHGSSGHQGDRFGCAPGLPDDAFEHDGLITKRHVRATALAYLRPRPGELLWDVGTGAGSIAIEWARAAAGARAIGLERDPDRAARARRNAAALAAPESVTIALGAADTLLADLPRPDAVFFGGGIAAELLATCWGVLPPRGRLVAHSVTIDSEETLVSAYRRWGGSLTRIAVETAEPLGSLLGWRPARAVVQWAAVRERNDRAPIEEA